MGRSPVILLAFVAGWVDAGSFVGLDRVMAAHITGNLVVLAASIEQGFKAADALKLIILPVFFMAVMVVTVVHDRAARRGERTHHLNGLLVAEATLLALTGALGAWATLADRTMGLWLSLVIVTPTIFAMAAQNAAHRLYPAIGPASTVMTGNITQFFIDRTRQLAGRASVSKINDMPKKEGTLPLLILAFGLGCLAGALATGAVGNGAFFGPAAVVLAIAAMLRNAPAE